MRTVEVLFVIFILLSSFVIITQFAVLPSPSQFFGTNLRELSESTLQTLDAKNTLANVVFTNSSDPSWSELERALSASLPPNIAYNLSVFDIQTLPNGSIVYTLENSISNNQGDLGTSSEATSSMVTSPDVTLSTSREKIGERTGQSKTLYILNCDDANGWWITGYSGQSLALDLYDLLSPYFISTVLVNSTAQLELLLNGSSIVGERLEDAVVINTFGEAVPIPSWYANQYPGGDYSEYCWALGQRVNQHNWTWVSIVGYPLFYVSNAVEFLDSDNNWGMYGMEHVGPAGLNAFLRGISNQGYADDDDWITGSPGLVQLTSDARDQLNYYGIYPFSYQTSTRALPSSILDDYNLEVRPGDYVFDPVADLSPPPDEWIAGATYSHKSSGETHGSLTAIGLTRIPDVRVTALALLLFYRPRLYRSEFGASGTSRFVTLQLSQQGGI